MSKKILSVLLALVMVLSVLNPVFSAAAAETQVQSTSADETGPDLLVGVLSDIHVSYDYVDEVYGEVSGYFNGVQPSRFEKALRFYKAQGVDAIIIAGDLQEASGTTDASLDAQKDWLQTVVDIWYEVFPEAPGEEGYVEPVVIYGNHDSALVAQQYWPEEWGTYQDAFVKEVNGYSFVCAHNAKEGAAAELLAKTAVDNTDKPIFYIQHCPVNNTVPGSTTGYGVGYGQIGRSNIADYPNVVAFNGHTHAPLTDESGIWQGDNGNEGQFTVINTATINYTSLNNDDMSVNGYKGNAQQTEHGMLMSITGSEVSVDRYSFNSMTIDTEANTVSGEAVKIGETWSWDACDVTDRPYAYDSRYENANAPVFADGAEVTVGATTDTSVTVTVPAATVTAPAGFSDMVESYVVEACDPTSGKVEATGRIATSYHVDAVNYGEETYTVTVSGLNPGTKYTLNVYAQEFFDKRSEPLTVNITTTGTLTTYRTGDVNSDGNVDAADMTVLKQILAGTAVIVDAADIDGNNVLETRDITELQAILDGVDITYPETGDLMDLVTEVKLTGVSTSTNYQPVDYGTIIQNSVVRGDSNQAVKTWTTNYAYYPVTTMYFDEPVDLTGYTHLSFDTLFENEYNLSDSYRKRWLSLSFVSGEQEQIASYGSMNFDSAGNGWTTTTVSLTSLKNIDLSAVTAIRFSHNFDYYEGRFDGVTEHAIYWDNFKGVYVEGADSDLLYTSTVTGGEAIYGAGYTNHTNHAIKSTGGTLDVTFQSEKLLSDLAGFGVDMQTPVTTTVTVQPYDADGNLLGTAITVDSCNIYRNKYLSVTAFGVAEGTYAAGLRFTYTCDHLLLDNMSVQGSKDYDLIGTADTVNPLGGDNCNVAITTEGTNGSNNALYASAMPGTSVWNGGAELVYDEPLDLSETPYLRFDLKAQNAHLSFYLSLYNSAGEVIWTTTHYNANSSTGTYATYEFDLRTYRTYDSENGYVNHEVSLEDLKDVAKISLTHNLASTPTWMEDDTTALREVWFDNLYACDPLEDMFGAATSLTGPSKVQDGFICEIMPSTSDGHTNVLHWYSDPESNSGTTDSWPGSTLVTIQKDVNWLNHSGYDGTSYDYVEFDIKTVGMYIAMYLTFKDASGATLGSTGEYRISYEQEWSTFRIDLNRLGMTADQIASIDTVEIGWNWQHQSVNSTVDKYVADIYIDNMGFVSIPEDTTDYLDRISLVNNADWWTGGNGKFTGGGWKFQSDVTVGSDNALMFYRSETSQNISYGSKTLYMYFVEPVTVESDWIISIDALKHNYNASGAKVQLIGSNGTKYDLFSFTHTGANAVNYSAAVSSISDFDPATTTITGLYFTYPMNPDSTMDKTALGYLVLDNLTIAAPPVLPEVDLDGADLIGIADSVEMNDASAFEDGFVFETLDSYDGREHVVHMYSDPANGGALINSSSIYYGAVITLSNDAIYNAEGVDFVEFYLKNTNIYCDNVFVEVLDSAGNSLGSVHKRMAMTSDWAYYRFDLATLGLTEEELSSISTVRLYVNWSKQLSTADAPVAGEVYVDDLTFGSYLDESTDLFDHIASVQNVEWWWSGNNTYGDAGWLMEADDIGSRYFTIYRGTEPDAGAGYTPRRQYMYFDEVITLNENFVVSIDATNTYMGTGTKISLLGDDGNKYGYLKIDQTGTYSYEMAITDFVLLNADTHMTVTETAIDVSTVKIIGVIFHNDFFNGDTTYEGSLVMDNFRIYDSTVEPEPTEPDTTEPDTTEPDTTEPYDGGDLLAGTNSIAYNKLHWENWDDTEDETETYTGLTTGVDTENLYGTDSVRSWYFKATAEANASEVAAQLAFDQAYDMTEKYLVFDVKYVNATEGASTTANVRLHNSSWTDVNTNQSFSVDAGAWKTVVLDPSTTLVSGKDLTDVKLITFTFDFASDTGAERAIYIDNVRLVDLETLDEDWIHCRVDSGSSGVVYSLTDAYTYGDNSSVSMRLDNTVDSTKGDDIYYNPESQFGSANLPDLKNKIVAAYFYFGDQTPYATLSLCDKNWSGVTAQAFRFEDVGDGWYYGQVNTSWITTHAATTDLSQIIRLGINIDSGAVVYVDDLQILPGETVEEDWINICLDTGATKGEYGPNTVYTYGEDSRVSLRFEPTDGSYITFHTQNEADRNGGAWDAYPDMTSGTFSFYVYFGDQTPSVKLQLTDSAWKYTTSTAMNLEDVGNGWYHATLDVSTMTTPDGYDGSSIWRIYLTFTAGQTVYIDEMELIPAPNPLEDMIANYTTLTGPTAVQENFVCEYLAETDDGHTDVIHLHATTDNGLTTSNWPGVTYVYTSAVPASVDTTVYDYVEFTYKHYGVKYAFYINFYDANGTALGTGTEIRTSNESGWATHRVDLTTAGLTAEEIATISYFTLSISWEYNNANGSYLQEGEMWFDNIRFGSVNEESTDLLDHVVRTYLSAGATATYPGSDWGWNDDGAFVITRDTTSTNWTSLRLYFDEALTVESDWTLSCDFDITNFHHGGSIAIIGSDGAVYSSIGPNKGGTNTVSKTISEFATSAGVAFDPTTVTIAGIQIGYSLGTSTNVTDTTTGGYMSLDNLILTDPTPAE